MRGRKPQLLQIPLDDRSLLQQLARSQIRPWYQVQHARIVLAIAAGERVQAVASQLQCDSSTVWRVCRRYEQVGMVGVVERVQRTGRPLQISPPAAGTNRSTGLS
jgi:Homeodomain-like domain